jgi:hypothetical protein
MLSSLSFLDSSIQSVKKEIPFLNVFSGDEWRELLNQEGIKYRERIFSPMTTLWTFVSQILSANHSCRSAVAQWIAACVGQGKPPCSSITSAYCRARQRLPESFYRRVALHIGQKLSEKNPNSWKWKGHEVKIVDGSTLKLPDTPENQREYPQSRSQKEGLGFPTVRILTVVSLSCGAVIDAAFSCIRGKGTGESALLRSLIHSFNPGDVLLGDRYFSGFYNLAYFIHHKIQVVAAQNVVRNKTSMKEIKRLKTNDRIVAIRRPNRVEFRWQDCGLTYDQFPPAILLREITFTIRRKGFRPKHLRVITTLINPSEYSYEDIIHLYAARWNIETDFLNMKVGLKMDTLRCKSPEMIRKEIWAHLIGYNFVRLVIAQSALCAGKTPRNISFQGCVQILQAFRPLLICTKGYRKRLDIYKIMLTEISKQWIGNRTGRYEPRILKRRPDRTYPFLNVPRKWIKKKHFKVSPN